MQILAYGEWTNMTSAVETDQLCTIPSDISFFRAFDAASVGMAVYTCAGVLAYTNDRFLHLSDCTVDEITSFFRGLPKALTSQSEEIALFNAIVSGECSSGTLPIRIAHRSGVVVSARINLHLIYDAQINCRYVVKELCHQPLHPDGLELIGRSRRDKAYAALQLLTQVILREFSLDGLMAGVHGVLRELMPADNCSIALTNGPGSHITFPYFADLRRIPPSARMFGNGLTEFVFIWAKPFLLKREEIEELESKGRVCPATPRPAVWLGVPLRTHAGRAVGVLAVRSYADGDAYTPEDLKLLELISGYVGGAIEAFRQQEELRSSEARFRAVFEHSGLGVCMVGEHRTILECNSRVTEMVDVDAAHLHHSDIAQLLAAESDRDMVLRQFALLADGKLDHFTFSAECLLPSGALFWCRQTFSAVRNSKGEFSFSVVLLEDITEHKLADDRLMHMAFHDALTGLPNRSLFTDRLLGAVRRARRHADYHFAVLFMDMDRFKVVNDSMGHKAGDELLVLFASRVQDCLRDSDTFARFGGDEFAVLLDDFDDVLQAASVVGRIQNAFSRPFKVAGIEIYSGASIGAVFRAREYERPEDILRDADAAMYRAKEGGSGRFEIFDRSLHAHLQDRLQLENAIRRGLEFSEFSQLFQPYVTLQSGRVRGTEALARWRQPGGTVLSPSAFIPSCEESGLIYDLDCLMLEQGCGALADWQTRYNHERSMVLNLNISAFTLQRWNMLDVFTNIIRQSGCKPSDICLEITENTLLKGEQSVNERLWRFKDMGMRIALDDFGTGFSSLNYLRQFPVNMIKVDRIFTSTVHEDRASYGIVQAIVSLGRGLGIEVVAEGVETSEQAQVLAELGCEAAQGDFYSKPISQERLFKITDCGRLPFAVG